ncbi:hypothetical protein F4809DRAFT_655348 [Biscogniauxia mediterranea]|nr:hypothetical protein F4809DRAFT_655348 [Biscogniauxia mediterranea]
MKKWGARKNLKTHEWSPVFDRIDRIPRGINSRVIICGRVMTRARLRRARRHCKHNCGRLTDSSLCGMPSNNQRSSNTTEQVHIETQDIDGKWVRLEDYHPPRPVAEQVSRSSVSEVTRFPEPEDQLATLGDFETIKTLIDSGADINKSYMEGAAEHGLDMIEFLWTVETGTFTLENVETGFQEKHCRKAMRLAVENGHMGYRDQIA